MNKIYLALYKGNAKSWRERLEDWLIRKVTKGQYSHCEIIIEEIEFSKAGHYAVDKSYKAYSASPRDGGVRCKTIDLKKGKWDLIELQNVTETQVKAYFEQTKGKKYDFWGALGVLFRNPQSKGRYFCSEWCFNVIFNSRDGWRFSPNDLAVMVKSKGVYA